MGGDRNTKSLKTLKTFANTKDSFPNLQKLAVFAFVQDLKQLQFCLDANIED